MKITNFEATGIELVENFLKENKGELNLNQLKELMKSINISFSFEDINRLHSTLICENGSSYVQQSQRYVLMDSNGYIKLEDFNRDENLYANELIGKAFDLYKRMTELKEDVKGKGRPSKEDYKYGITPEDARYILPLATKTNVTYASSGDKFVDLITTMCESRYAYIFAGVLEELRKLLPENLWEEISDSHFEAGSYLVQKFYQDNYFSKINNINNMVFFDSFKHLDKNVALGALTSTKAETPSQVFESWLKDKEEKGEEWDSKAKGVINRVLGYGHTGIMEQARTTFGMMMSLSAYHQQIRHRLPALHREELSEIIKDKNREVIIPHSILNSIFREEYATLVEDFKNFRYELARYYDHEFILPLLLNCDQVKLVISTNARIDEWILRERTCMTAQWEIRNLSIKKLKQLRTLSDVLYEKALPPCVYGTCKEGKLTCGKATIVKEFFTNLKEE